MKVDDLEIPDEWVVLLTELKVHVPNAILAGGAMRDLYNGVAPKDLDFFGSPIDLLPNWAESGPDLKMDYEGMKYVNAVQTFIKGSLPIQFIHVEPISTEELLSSFDLGICQIGFDGARVIKTSAFEWDVKHGLITMRHIDRYRRSIQRYCRINQRYKMDLAIPQLDALTTVAANAQSF